MRRLILLFIATIVFSVITAVYQVPFIEFAASRIGVYPAVILYCALMTFLALSGIVVSAFLYRLWVQDPTGVRGLVFFVSLVAVIPEATLATSAVVTRQDLNAVFESRSNESNAWVTALAPGVVEIYGVLGPELMHDYLQIEQTTGSVVRIEITSEGGLIDQALSLARKIEREKIPVTVRDYCYSACALIAVASPRLVLEADALLGLHRSYSVAELSTESFQYWGEEQEKDVSAFLRTHGIPADILEEADKFGPEELYYLSADDLREIGLITDTQDQPVDSVTDRKSPGRQ